MGLFKSFARVAAALVGALLLTLAHAGSAFAQAQGQVTNEPIAPPIVFLLLLLGIFVAVLAFSFKAFQDARR